MPVASFLPSGIVRDIPAADQAEDHWTDGQNVVFRKGYAQRASRGRVVFEDASLVEPPVYVQSSITFDLNAWLYGADDGVNKSLWVTDGNTHKDITPTVFNPWIGQLNELTGGNVSGLPFINWGNGSASWDRDFGTPSLMDPLPGAPGCNAMRSHQNRIIAINTVDSPLIYAGFPQTEQTIAWASLPVPGAMPTAADWIPAVDNSAGDGQLSGGGPLIDGFSLRSSFIVYGQDRTWIMDEVGGSFVFSIRKLSSTTGVLSRNCVAATPEGHVVLSGDDVYINDGTNFRSIIDNVNKVNLFTQIGDNYQNCWVAHYASRAEIWIAFPTGSNIYPDQVYIMDTGTRRWGQRQLPNIPAAATGPIPFANTAPITWDDHDLAAFPGGWDDPDLTKVWNQAIESSAISGLILADPDLAGTKGIRFVSIDDLVGGPNAGLFNQSTIQKEDMDFGDASRRKTLRRVRPRFPDGVGQMELRVAGRDNLADSINYSPSVVFNRQDSDIPVFAEGRYISVLFQQFGSAIDWELTGFDCEFEWGGRF